MHETTRTKALAALEGMRQIVRREMLIQGEYVALKVSNPKLSGAICGGRKHCAVGSLWAGAGYRPQLANYGWGDVVTLPGVKLHERKDFLRPRHGLRAAYDALNAAAVTFADKHGLEDVVDHYESPPIEALFEGYYGDALTKRDLLGVIASAKRTVKAS